MISNKEFSDDQIGSITIYLPAFQAKGFTFSHTIDPVQDRDGYWTMGYEKLSDLASSFVKALHDNGWILSGFDWASYSRSGEYKTLTIKDDDLDTASSDQLARILTTILRRDRFASGWLVAAYNDGLLTRILTRLQAIRSSSCSSVA